MRQSNILLIWFFVFLIGCGESETNYYETYLPVDIEPQTCDTQINIGRLQITCNNGTYLLWTDRQVVEITELCWQNGEVIVELEDGTLKWLKLNRHKARLKDIPYGWNVTTDGENCLFNSEEL